MLIVAPWSSFWDRNLFADALPAVEGVFASPFARGAVSGVGFVTLLGGLAELGSAFALRRARANVQQPRPTLPTEK